MIEHPVITATERWGYPYPPDRETIHCEYCQSELFVGEPVFEWDGDLICEECCRNAVEESFSFFEIASALRIPTTTIEEL